MRDPIEDKSDESNQSIEDKAEVARSLVNNASIKTKDSETDLDIELIINGPGKYSKDSIEKKIFSFKVNLYEKAALYIFSKKHKKSMQDCLMENSLNAIVKSSESDGLSENIVRNLHRKKLIK